MNSNTGTPSTPLPNGDEGPATAAPPIVGPPPPPSEVGSPPPPVAAGPAEPSAPSAAPLPAMILADMARTLAEMSTHLGGIAADPVLFAGVGAATAGPALVRPAPQLAQRYLEEAAKLRRRAQQRSGEDALNLQNRAAWYEARAPYKRDGLAMPHELRTKSEAVNLVDKLRRDVIGVMRLLHVDLRPEDVAAARGAIQNDMLTAIRTPITGRKSVATPDEVTRLHASVRAWAETSMNMLEHLGVTTDTRGELRIAPYVVEAVET